MYVSGSLINAYYICFRKCWLLAHEFLPDSENEFLEIGRLITQTTFLRDKKEIEMAGIKIDLLKKREGDFLVGEIKKSSKGIEAGIVQLAYYLYCLKIKGINLKGEILIPKERKRICVELDEKLEKEVKETISKVKEIIEKNMPPPPIKISFCRKCAYNEFCWAEV